MGTGTQLVVADGIGRLTLDDGKVNALSPARIAEIEAALDTIEKAGALAVLRGRPGIFSAGFDLKTFAQGAEAGAAMVRAGAELVLRILSFPRPVLTVCTGHAYPAGAFLMLAADSRLGARGAFQIGMNETAIGLTVPKFALELARHRLTAPGFARIQSAALFAPDEALRLGYLDRVVEAAELDAAASQEAERLRALDANAFAATKARCNERALAAIRRAIEDEWSAASGRG
jgi:enoyl-CoA hydratase